MTAVTSYALGLLGLAHKAGKLEIGEEPVGASCRARHAKAVLLASDAADNTIRRAQRFSQTAKVPCVQGPFSKAELGWQLGRTSCAVLAIADNGMAASLLAKLAQEDPEQFGDAARQLEQAAAKTLQRQKEQARHAKKLHAAGRKPWAAPPKER